MIDNIIKKVLLTIMGIFTTVFFVCFSTIMFCFLFYPSYELYDIKTRTVLSTSVFCEMNRKGLIKTNIIYTNTPYRLVCLKPGDYRPKVWFNWENKGI